MRNEFWKIFANAGEVCDTEGDAFLYRTLSTTSIGPGITRRLCCSCLNEPDEAILFASVVDDSRGEAMNGEIVSILYAGKLFVRVNDKLCNDTKCVYTRKSF